MKQTRKVDIDDVIDYLLGQIEVAKGEVDFSSKSWNVEGGIRISVNEALELLAALWYPHLRELPEDEEIEEECEVMQVTGPYGPTGPIPEPISGRPKGLIPISEFSCGDLVVNERTYVNRDTLSNREIFESVYVVGEHGKVTSTSGTVQDGCFRLWMWLPYFPFNT